MTRRVRAVAVLPASMRNAQAGAKPAQAPGRRGGPGQMDYRLVLGGRLL